MRNLLNGFFWVALMLSPSLAAAATNPSASGTTIPSATQIVDGQLNVWMLSGGQAYENSQLTPSGGVILLLYYDGIVYQENVHHGWWKWLDGAWVASSDPRIISAGSATIPFATNIVDGSHNVWILSGGQAYMNGEPTPSAGVILLLYAKGTVYQENIHHNWWLWRNGAWETTSAPLVASASGTAIPTSTQIVDSRLNTWTTSGGHAYKDGALTPSAGVILLLFYQGSVYQENIHHDWWRWTSGGWVATPADPRVPALAAAVGYKTLTFDSTVVGTTSGTWQRSNLNGIPGCNNAVVQNDDGSFTISGHRIDKECYVASAIKSSSGTHGWTGVTFKPGMYIKIVMSYTGTNPGTGALGLGLPAGVPAFWGVAIEHADGGKQPDGAFLDQWPGQAPDYEHWMEADFFEAFCGYLAFQSTGCDTSFDPANKGTSSGQISLFDDSGAPTNQSGATASSGWDFKNGETWATQHTLEIIYVPASSSARGYIAGYIDGVKFYTDATWAQYNPALPPQGYSNYFSIGDTEDMVLVAGTGTYADLTVYSVQVWQASQGRMTQQ